LLAATAVHWTGVGPIDGQARAKFDKAWQFDAAMLARLPVVTIQPTLEYDAKLHKLSGPLLSSVVEAAGVITGSQVMLACAHSTATPSR